MDPIAIDPSFFDYVMQGGFAGFAFLLLVGLFWMIKQWVTTTNASTKAIQNSTNVAVSLKEEMMKQGESTQKLYEHLLQRPCMLNGPNRK